MRVDPSMWDPPLCEGLLYSCCIGVVNLTFSAIKSPSVINYRTRFLKIYAWAVLSTPIYNERTIPAYV
jgi:hypothetical protein